MLKMLYPAQAILVAGAILVSAGAASAHITLENKEVKAGSVSKFVVRVPHGCAGEATTAVRLAVPEGLSSVKPQPKPGWELSLVTDDIDQTTSAGGHDSHGAAVKELAWSGGNLPDAYYDEFVFRASVDKDAPDVIYVPIVQECEGKTERWIEVPTQGGSSDQLSHPAPAVRIQR